jgi:uroporphyrinogen-III synthase
MADLHGKSIVILEARLPSQLASLVTRHGGRPIEGPALREIPVPRGPEIDGFIDLICAGRLNVVVFQTGVGARALIAAADEVGRREELLTALRAIKIVCRGPKPVAALRSVDVQVDLFPPEPFTSHEVVETIRKAGWDLQSKRIGLQHYGELNVYLRTELISMGAEVTEVSLYGYALPEDTGPLQVAIHAIIDGHADAVMFTTQVQIRHLFAMAEQMDVKIPLKEAMSSPAIAIAPVGPVCVSALEAEGITPDVVPEHPKMGPLVLALADHFESLRPPTDVG